MKKTEIISLLVALIITGCTVSLIDKDRRMVIDFTAPEVVVLPAAMYEVKAGDSLWNIAALANIYDNPFMWPMIYRSNIDQIEDPDIIDVGQRLTIKKVYSNEQEIAAIREAQLY